MAGMADATNGAATNGAATPEGEPHGEAMGAGASTHEHTDTLPQPLAPDAAGSGGEEARGETTVAVPPAAEHPEALAHREPAGTGIAQVRKVTSSERQSLEVPMTHDELRVERVPVTDEVAARSLGPDVFTEKDIDVPLMGEEVELEKRIRVTEEVVLRKRQVTEQRTYTGDVRKERVWDEGADRRAIAAADGGTRAAGARHQRRGGDHDDRLAQDQEGPEEYRQ